MSWIGRKKLAFVPLHRPNFDPHSVPTDWPNDIRKRVFFDPDPTAKVDRSLRAYLLAASSGRADLDAAVMPMQIVDRQDVPVDFLEPQLGAQLRSQGFDAAALVMLGDPPTGTSERGGFWARFDMSEGLGVWAMEFMHVLTGFNDLYPFGGNIGAFDEMSASGGTHPSAYTKAAIGWLDGSAIAQYASPASFDLHAVGLVQPPPSGRFAAVKIGAQVPYLMVEARQRVDQFDANIPGEGVIVYRVQTTDPLGTAQNATAPVQLLTTLPLGLGAVFTSDTGARVQVAAAIAGGFTIHIDDPAHTIVPDVFELTATAATNAIHAAGLVPKFTGINQTHSWVSSQSPSARTTVLRGSTVTMVLRTGPVP